jgi:hypothetical protein
VDGHLQQATVGVCFDRKDRCLAAHAAVGHC